MKVSARLLYALALGLLLVVIGANLGKRWRQEQRRQAIQEIYDKKIATVRRLVDGHLDIEMSPPLLANAVQAAIQAEDRELLTRLLDRGADLDACHNGDTALTLVAYSGNLHMTRFLVEHGADVNRFCPEGGSITLPQGATPLAYALRMGHLDVARFLLAHGAKVDARGFQGVTPLLACALPDRVASVQLLLQHRANVNLPDNRGDTPLMSAARCGGVELTEVLLAQGAEVNARRKDGQTALTQAIEGGFLEIVRLLIAHGAEVNGRGPKGRRPLQYAS